MALAPRRLAWALASALGGLIAARPAVARADDAEDLAALLDEHVVSAASKSDELAKDAPATTSVLTAEDIQRYGIRSLSEAINFLGMGLVTQDPLHSVEVGGRGVLLTSDYGNHVLLVVDGHVYNEPWDGTAYFEQGAGVPMELVDHVELVLGPGSVLYGGNAMIGVVNVVTKRASAWRGVHFVAEGGASPQQGRYGQISSWAPIDAGGSYRLGVGVGHEWTMFGLPADVVAQAELYEQNGPTFVWGPQKVTNDDGTPTNFGPKTPLGVWGGRAYDQYATSIPALYARGHVGDLAVTFRAESYRRTTPFPNGFNQTTTDFDEPRSFERDRWVSIDAQYQRRVGERLRLSARGYADAYDYLQNTYNSDPNACAVAPDGPCLLATNGHSRWFGTEVQADYDWFGNGKLATLAGVNGTVRNIGGATSSIDADRNRTLEVDGDKSLTEVVGAAYLQQRYNPAPIVHLNAGARYDADPRGGDRLSPRAAAAVDVWRGGELKVIYAEAFRAPTFYEAFYQSPDQKPNPAIRSETVRGAESTFEQRLGRHKLLFGAFRTWWNDMLALRPIDDGVYQYENVSRIDSYGYNARVEGTFGALAYGASITGAYTRRITPDGSDPLPVAPQLFGNARAAYKLPGAWPTVALATSFVGKRPADRAFDGNFSTMPYAPASAEIRLTVSQAIPGVPGLSYRVGASTATGAWAPYVAGPIQGYDAADPNRGRAELTPVVRFLAFGTLRYDLPL